MSDSFLTPKQFFAINAAGTEALIGLARIQFMCCHAALSASAITGSCLPADGRHFSLYAASSWRKRPGYARQRRRWARPLSPAPGRVLVVVVP